MKSLRITMHRADVALLRFAFWWASPSVRKFRWRLFFAVAFLLAAALIGHVLLLHTAPPTILLLGGPLWYLGGMIMHWLETSSSR